MSYSPFKLPTDWTVNTMDAENKTVAAWSSCKLEDEAFFFFFMFFQTGNGRGFSTVIFLEK